MPLSLTDSITSLPLVGPAYANKLTRLDVHTIQDLLHHYPTRYLDRSQISTISTLQPDQPATIIATVIDFKNIYTRTGKNLQQAQITDSTGQITVTWFNQRYLEQAIRVGESYAFSGKTKLYRGHLSLTAPEFEKVKSSSGWCAEADPQRSPPATKHEPGARTSAGKEVRQGPLVNSIHTGRLVPIYPETAGVSSKWLRSRLKLALENVAIPEILPQQILNTYQLIDYHTALQHIHLPPDQASLKTARHRLAFNELFILQLQGAIKRQQHQQHRSPHTITLHPESTQTFIKSLPFTLTKAQQNALYQIHSDIQQSVPMNRLLEGDVGSGKTVVSAIAMYNIYLCGFKSLLMAPTEILAHQHHQSLEHLFRHTNLTIGLHTSSTKTFTHADIVVGTHALLYNFTKDPQVALVVIDEQHRFGVKQRAQFEHLGTHPHRLTMSATPIPRTVALTLYGDLDVSIIDQLPQHRKPIKTWIVPHVKRKSAYQWVDQQISHHQAQVFVVCPLIDPSTSLKLSEVTSVTQEHTKLQKIFPHRTLDTLHGKLKSQQKDQIIHRFRKGQTQILISTSVIEVGIDIPQASIIIIEAAERFGLAQLHQLRGRVGRGDRQSYCLLFTSTDNKTESRRLQALTRHNSGFKLAEIDLKLRGPGEVFGLSQHGFTNLKLARLSDHQLLQQTKQAAHQLLHLNPQLQHLPYLNRLLHSAPNTITFN